MIKSCAKLQRVLLLNLTACALAIPFAPAALAAGGGAHHLHEAKAPAPTPQPGVNAVQNEMRLLTEAMDVIVRAVANNDLKTIPPAIQKVHQARQLTEKALESGTYKLAKGSDRLEAFIKEDEAFHDELVVLMKAVKGNNLQQASRQVGVLMNSCTNCHTKFRF